MARSKTQNVPDLSALLTRPDQVMLAVQRALLRGNEWADTAAPVAEQVAARLAGVITLNLIKAGQRLLENDISQVLRVSRAPVREALRILERDRLVEFHPRRGAVVTAPDAQELGDIFTVRRALYVRLFQQLMADRPQELAHLLGQRLAVLEKAATVSVDAYAVESFLLNLDIDDLGANRLLADLLKSISLRTLRYVRLGVGSTPDGLHGWLRNWRALHRAVARGETPLVLRMVAERIDGIRNAAVGALAAD
jgi:DNA-binding GntR family transcriptional regulator